MGLGNQLSDATVGQALGLSGLGAGVGALGQALAGSEQEVQSFRDVFPSGSRQDNLVDPAQLLFFTNQGAARLGQALTELAEQPVSFGPASIAQSPLFFHGGDLPFPIGVSGIDPGFKPIPGKVLNDPFNSLGGFDGGGGGGGDFEIPDDDFRRPPAVTATGDGGSVGRGPGGRRSRDDIFGDRGGGGGGRRQAQPAFMASADSAQDPELDQLLTALRLLGAPRAG